MNREDFDSEFLNDLDGFMCSWDFEVFERSSKLFGIKWMKSMDLRCIQLESDFIDRRF